MKLLINATNIKAGGGIQVTDSFCCMLNKYVQHHFVVVLTPNLFRTKNKIQHYDNVTLYEYTIKNNFSTLILGRDKFLDTLVAENEVEAVLTIFGPSRWVPKVAHISGFASGQLVQRESPYFKRRMAPKLFVYELLRGALLKSYYKRCSSILFTENPSISDSVSRLFKSKRVFTVTNSYNQVFDNRQLWAKSIKLPGFEGVTLLTIASPQPHKNLPILVDIVDYLIKAKPRMSFRFILTIDREDMKKAIAPQLLEHFVFLGKVDISECPYLYEQSDIMFMPTLVECFTATYPEAMRMDVPIVTTDLEFARGLCGDAAEYYDALNPEAAAEAIYKVATDSERREFLIHAGREQLKKFDNYEQRADKLIHILEQIVVDNKKT